MHIHRRVRFERLRLTKNIFKLPIDYSCLLVLDLYYVSLNASLYVKLIGTLKQIEELRLDIFDWTDDLDEANRHELIDIPSLKSLFINVWPDFLRHIGETGIKKLDLRYLHTLGKLKYRLYSSKTVNNLLIYRSCDDISPTATLY
jgi:hypothetical protein